jgi:ribonuclease D
VDSLTQDLLRVLLSYIAEKEEVAERILAPSKDLAALARHKEKADVPCLKGWRQEIFGHLALDLLAGKISLAVEEGKLVVHAHTSA